MKGKSYDNGSKGGSGGRKASTSNKGGMTKATKGKGQKAPPRKLW